MLRRVAIAVLAALGCVGCGYDVRQPASTPTDVVVRPASSSPTKPATPPPQESADAPKAVEPPVAAPTSPAEEPADSPNRAAPTDQDSSPPGGRERIAVLTPGGPLLIDVWLTVDGRPHTEGFDQLLKQILEAGDTDGDGKPTWYELVANEKFLASPLAGARNLNNSQARSWIEQFDVNRDNHIQPSEAKSWLGRDASRGADAFAVRSEKSYAPEPSAASSVWRFLDRDRDGRLSEEERHQAPTSLWTLDEDDDRVIALPELATLREQLAAAPDAGRLRGAPRYAAIHLHDDEEAERLYYLLQDTYAPRQDLNPKSFRDFPALFANLDANDDQWLDPREMARLFKIDAHLELVVEFDGAGKPPAAVRVWRSSPELDAPRSLGPDRIDVWAGGARLIISAHDLSGAGDGDQPMDGSQVAGRTQIRLMIHDRHDALFDALDADGDLRLGEREVAFGAEKLKACDADRDGQITEDELPYAMIVAFLRGEPARQQSYYVPPRAMRMADGVQPPKWFKSADFNSDGVVSRREFLGDGDQFRRLDVDGDGYLDAAEIVGFASEEDRAG